MKEATGAGDIAGEGGTLSEYRDEDAELYSLLISLWYESSVRASISAVEVDGLRCRTGATLALKVEGSLDDVDTEDVDEGS